MKLTAGLMLFLVLLTTPTGAALLGEGWSVGIDTPRSSHDLCLSDYCFDSTGDSGLLVRRDLGRRWDIALSHSPSRVHTLTETYSGLSSSTDDGYVDFNASTTWTRLRIARSVLDESYVRCAVFVEGAYAWTERESRETPLPNFYSPVEWTESWGWSLGLRPEVKLGKRFLISTRFGIQLLDSRSLREQFDRWNSIGDDRTLKISTGRAWRAYGGLEYDLWSGLTVLYAF